MSKYLVPEFRYRPLERSHLRRTEREKPDPSGTVSPSEVCLSILPVGEIEARFVATSTFVDINVAAAPTTMAVNSDRLEATPTAANSFGFIPRGTDFWIKSDNKAPCILLEIGDTALQNWSEGVDLDPSTLQEFRNYSVDQAMGSFGHMATVLLQDLQTTNRPTDIMTMEAVVLGISARLIRNISTQIPGSRLDVQLISSRNDNRLVRSVEFAMEHLSNPALKVADLAAEAGMSVHHYSDLFKQWQGMSPYAFIRLERLNAAQRLLTTTGTPIATIAYETGFSSQAHLTTAFKSAYGVTPGKYRS